MPDTTTELVAGSLASDLKAFGSWLVAAIGALGAWWAWRTSILKTMGDRVTLLEQKIDRMGVDYAAAQLRVAEVTGENIALRAELQRERADAAMWRAKYRSRAQRHEADTEPLRKAGQIVSLETSSDAEAADDIAAADALDTPRECELSEPKS